MSVRKVVLTASLMLSFIFFVLGLCYPILVARTTLLGFNVSSESIHLTDTLLHFYNTNDWFMVMVIGVTTIIFPVYKYMDMLNRVWGFITLSELYTRIIAQLDKWSMLEVFVIALVILSVKSNSSFMTMTVKSGVYFLAASVIVRMLISSYMAFTQKSGT